MSTDSNAAIPAMLADYDSQTKDEAIVAVLDRVCANINDSAIFYHTGGAIVARNVLAARILKIDQKHFSTLKTVSDLLRVLAERGDYGDVKVEKEVKRRENRLMVPISRTSFFLSHLKTLDEEIRVRLSPVTKELRMMTLSIEGEQASESANKKKESTNSPRRARPKDIAHDVNALLADDPDEARLYKEDTYESHVSQAVKHANVLDASFALLAIDFPEFESLARARGEDVVFYVYMSMVEHLKQVTRNIDVLINVDNRRFLAIIECEDVEIIKKVARRILNACGQPLPLHPKDQSKKQRFTVNIGAAVFPDSVKDLDEAESIAYFRKRAEIAADWARQKGSTDVVVFDVDDAGRLESPVTEESA